MPPVGFEPTISAGERPQTYALERAATTTTTTTNNNNNNNNNNNACKVYICVHPQTADFRRNFFNEEGLYTHKLYTE
jgi:hypothetical protein